MPQANATGGVVARLNLKLDKDVEPLPKDSIFRVRYRSTFGLKYLEIVRGEGKPAPEGFTFDGTDDSGTVARCRSTPTASPPRSRRSARNGCFQPQTEFDDIANTFDTKTRTAVRTNLEGFGNAFAGRGTSLNDAISSLQPLFRGLRPVTKVLIEPSTRFRRFFPALGNVARIVAPVAEQQADVFTKAAITFAAISAPTPVPLQETITETAPTLADRDRRAAAPAPVPDSTCPTLGDRAAPRGRRTCGRRCRCSTTRSRSGRPVPRRLTALEPQARGRPALAERGSSPSRAPGSPLQRLEDTFDTAQPLAKYVVPAQTVCNYFNYWFTFVPNGLSDRDQIGFSFRQSLTRFPAPADDPDAQPTATRPRSRTAERRPSLGGVFKPYELPILNAHPYGPTGQNDADCQGGQSGYELGQGLVPGQSPSNPAYAVPDQPGSRGPTTLFYNDDNRRELHDTRIDSRQPETWKGIGR